MSSSIICEVVIIPKTIIKILYRSHSIVNFFSKPFITNIEYGIRH